jgi:dTDP-glucose 4,6-dehydratase
MIFVTGGAGFIGSNFILNWLDDLNEPIVNIDKLTYAGNLKNLSTLKDSLHHFVKGDIQDSDLLDNLFEKYQPRALINFAAESHVDRSIAGPDAFIKTNIIGTFTLLESTRKYLSKTSHANKERFRFLHVSTDEVYGSLSQQDPAFTEEKKYEPNSPYSASKAASDHLVRAWNHTYSIPVLTTNCSNNYGPFQFPEKLIPLTIIRAIEGKTIPIYGDGLQVRDWLYVSDHCEAIRCVLENGKIGETYNIGGSSEMKNIEVVRTICGILDSVKPRNDGKSYTEQITHVSDRAGHDRRYAVDTLKISSELGWTPKESFESGILKTVMWYINNDSWITDVQTGEYRNWISTHYGNVAS